MLATLEIPTPVQTQTSALTPALSSAVLLDQITQTLALAVTHIEQAYQDFDGEIHGHFRVKDKAANETAYLTYMASRIPNFPAPELIETLKSKLVEIASEGRLDKLLKRYPATVGTLGYLPMFLGCLGIHTETWDQAIQAAIRSGRAAATERVPFRLIELHYMYALYCGNTADYDALIPLSVLANNSHPIYMDQNDAYALTHILMYVTDHGREPLPTSIDRIRISNLIDASLAYYLMIENVDIVVELLMCVVALGDSWSPYALFAWHYVQKIWHELGHLPGPRDMSVTARPFMRDAQDHDDFARIYHTTYMGAILNAMVLTNPPSDLIEIPWTAHLPVTLIEACKVGLTRAQKILGAIELEFQVSTPADSILESITSQIAQTPGFCSLPDARWKVTLEDAPLSEIEAAMVLIDGLITQSCVYYDLDTLAKVLHEVMVFELPISFTVIEGITFLLRQQCANGLFGAHLFAANPALPFTQQITRTTAITLAAIQNRFAS